MHTFKRAHKLKFIPLKFFMFIFALEKLRRFWEVTGNTRYGWEPKPFERFGTTYYLFCIAGKESGAHPIATIKFKRVSFKLNLPKYRNIRKWKLFLWNLVEHLFFNFQIKLRRSGCEKGTHIFSIMFVSENRQLTRQNSIDKI